MFAEKLTKILCEKNITITALSKMANLSNGYICDLKNGEAINPSLDTITKIAKALNVKASELLD
jgi:transcriptional regulator with XRE-family HTH domain